MYTSTASWTTSFIDNSLKSDDQALDSDSTYSPIKLSSFWLSLTTWFTRLVCIIVVYVCPWANYKLIKLFQTDRFHKESSAKWYIIFKAVVDIIYMFLSVSVMLLLTYGVDLIHQNAFTCRIATYLHYLSDDLTSIMLALLCVDRMKRITCSCHLRKQVSLTICIIITSILCIMYIHHIVRLEHKYGFCQKKYLGILDSDFDVYYSFLLTTITWTTILIASINLLVSVYCDRERRLKLKKILKEQSGNNIVVKNEVSNRIDSDRRALIDETEHIDGTATVVIEENKTNHELSEKEQQDNVDLQITVSTLILSAVFICCNLPTYIIFIKRYIFNSLFSRVDHIVLFISVVPTLFAHTVPYFIFNHLAKRFYPGNTS